MRSRPAKKNRTRTPAHEETISAAQLCAQVPAEAKIHTPGVKRLDLVLEFVAFVARPMPLSVLLDEAPKRIAAIVDADVASLYLLEGEGNQLVLRGNVGFPLGARGNVRLSVGEGLTGTAVATLRPVSVDRAPSHERFRLFPELHEERFPVFLAVPILGHQRALGALVVQRAGDRSFKRSDVELVVGLTAPISAGIRHAQLIAEDRERTLGKPSRRTGGGTRKVTLPGVPVVSGRALGAVAALRRPASLPQRTPTPEDAKLLHGAFDVVGKALGTLVTRAALLDRSDEAAFLSAYLLMASDTRLRERTFELLSQGHSVAQALGLVAREAARVANGIVGDPFMQERARDIEDFCDALLMLASPDARAELPSKAVLLGAQISVFDLLVSARAHPVGIVLTEPAGPRTRVLLQLMNVPSIIDASGAFRWASPGDVALLDADHGFLVINPSRAEIASVRAARRKDKTPAHANSLLEPPASTFEVDLLEPPPTLLGEEIVS